MRQFQKVLRIETRLQTCRLHTVREEKHRYVLILLAEFLLHLILKVKHFWQRRYGITTAVKVDNDFRSRLWPNPMSCRPIGQSLSLGLQIVLFAECLVYIIRRWIQVAGTWSAAEELGTLEDILLLFRRGDGKYVAKSCKGSVSIVIRGRCSEDANEHSYSNLC